MRFCIKLGLIAALLIQFTPSFADDATWKEMDDLLKEMITMLETNKHREFVERFMNPDMVKKFKESGQFAKIVENFKIGKADELLKTLKKAQDVNPEIENDGKKATYKSDQFRRPLIFEKIKGKWHLMN
jgi:hypothetical protein